MRIYLTILGLLIFTSSVFSQENDKGDKKSREMLDKLTAKTEAYNSIYVEFSYKMNNKEANIDESTEGALTIMKDNYKLNIAGQLVICDGETIWTYIEDAEEVQVNSVEESEESITPNKLLTAYNDDYRSKFIKEDFQYGATVNIIDLTPLEGKSYYKVRLIIDKEKDQLHDITIFDKNGSTYSYIIKTFTPNVEVEASAFTFNESDYPDVDVVDMR